MLAAMCAVVAVVLAAEVPSDADVRAIGKYLDELTKDDRQSLRQKKTTKEQYGDALVGYAADEKKSAAKFALFKEAFKAYADAKSYEKAGNVYSSAQAEGGTEYALAVAGNVIVPGVAKEFKARIEDDKKSYRQIGIIKKKLKKSPGDEALCEALGLEYAAVGNWEGALAAFLTASGEVAKVADWEQSKGSAYTAAKAAKFWWDYADGKPKAKMEAVRLHAAMWYEFALGANAYSGNEAKIVQGRIDETKSYGGAAMQEKATVAKQVNELKPIVIEVKSKTLVEFVGVPAGEFMMGTDERIRDFCRSAIKSHKVIITRPFWLSKFKVTKEVWSAYHKVSLTDYDKAVGGMRVPERVSYHDAIGFCNWLTKRVRNKLPKGYIVRLPTEAEWEYAFKVKENPDSPYRNWRDENNISQIAWTRKGVRELCANKGFDASRLGDKQLSPVEVGMKRPNGLGIHDMIGNGDEFIADTFSYESFEDDRVLWSPKNEKKNGFAYEDEETDPLRWRDGATSRCICRGVTWNIFDPFLYAKHGKGKNESATLRLCIGPDLMKEKGYSLKPGKKK